MPLLERTIKFTTEAGFPAKAYSSIVDWLGRKGFEVFKVKDWLEINPKTAYHQDVAQRRQALEQSLGRVMSNISELRKDIEMIKHDLRKFEQVKKHIDEGKDDVLKADYIDLIDSQSPSSMIKLQGAGRFPSIVIDFMRVKNKEELDQLKATKSEKNIIEIKLKLFNEWKEEYGKAVKERVDVLREELSSRNASLDNYKASIQPYSQALGKIKLSEGHFSGLTDPLIIGSQTHSMTGIELVAWRGMEVQENYKLPEERFSHFIYFDIKIRKDNATVGGKEIEGMKIELSSDLKDLDFINKKREEIKNLENTLAKELEKLRGKDEEKKPQEKEEADKFSKTLTKIGEKGRKQWKKLSGEKGKYNLPGDYGKPLTKAVVEETFEFYGFIKKTVGAI